MPHRTLGDFLEELGRAGELASVDTEVDPNLEAAEITRRVAGRTGPALLFRRLQGHDLPLLTNLLGSEPRVCRALGVEAIEEAADRIDHAWNPSGSEGWLEKLRTGTRAGPAGSFLPNRVKSGACQQIVRFGADICLGELPCPLSSREIATPAILSATILSAEPDTHSQIFLQGDMQIGGHDRLVAAWSEIGGAVSLIQQYAERQARMPIAIVIGGDPTVHLAAAAPVPAAVDPLGLAGLLRERSLDAVACRTVDLLAPAESDIMIEGYIDPTDPQTRTAQRFSPTDRILADQPGQIVHVTAVTHRANRIFPAAIAGLGCNETCVRDRAMARVFLPLFKMRMPELADFELPLSGGARHLAILAIRKTYAGQALHAATVAWGMRPFCFARLLIIVDAETELRDPGQIWTAVASHARLDRDFWSHAAPWDPLDATAVGSELGRRMGIDATRKFASEGCGSGVAQHCGADDVEKLVTDRWVQYGLGEET
jgi:4-hydroxy-3-polyprenylbenzoate decarboxylase